MERRVGRLADGLEGRGQRLGRVVQIIAHAARARRELVARPPADVRRRRREGRHRRGPAPHGGRGDGRRLAERPGDVGAPLRVAVDAALGRDERQGEALEPSPPPRSAAALRRRPVRRRPRGARRGPALDLRDGRREGPAVLRVAALVLQERRERLVPQVRDRLRRQVPRARQRAEVPLLQGRRQPRLALRRQRARRRQY